MKRYLITDWDGNSVVRSHWRKAKAELRRANLLSYCASVKTTTKPTDSTWADDTLLGSISFHLASRLAKELIKESL
jgi:hypothetical protein